MSATVDYSLLYNMESSNRDFRKKASFGKNTFTNAFPVSLISYAAIELNLDPNYLYASLDNASDPQVEHMHRPLADIIGVDPKRAQWNFESKFIEYDAYTTNAVQRSDLVVLDAVSNKQKSAFEVKLVTVPNSGTVTKPREEQSCELVVRPATIEQMCLSVAASFGQSRRHDIGDIVASKLINPMYCEWGNEQYMLYRIPEIIDATEEIIRQDIDSQRPFALNTIWRTKGQTIFLDEECFDFFFWSDLAFLQLFTRSAKRSCASNGKEVSRPARALVWFIKSLLDYSIQGEIQFGKTHSEITYGGQTDKAGSFSGPAVFEFLGIEDFVHPRVPSDAYRSIIDEKGLSFLAPERRLDGYITTAEVLRQARSSGLV